MKIPTIQNLQYARACGGNGINDRKQTSVTNQRSFLDMPFVISQTYCGIYVVAFSCGSSNNGGGPTFELYLCPESERDNATAKNVPLNNGPVGGPATFIDTKWFTGVGIYLGNATGNSLNSKAITAQIQRGFFVPFGFFLRVLAYTGTSDVCFLSMTYSNILDPCTDIEV